MKKEDSFLLIVVVLIVSILIRATVLQILWTWYIMPVFNSFYLPLSAAIGIELIAALITGSKSTDRGIEEILMTNIGVPLMILILGGLFHLTLELMMV